MNAVAPHPLFIRVADDLATHGWSQQNIFIPTDLTTELAEDCCLRTQRGEPLDSVNLRDTAATERYLQLMQRLQQVFKQTLSIHLSHYHCHFIQRLVKDTSPEQPTQLPETPAAKITSVLFLNDHWLPEYGGELRLQLDTGRCHDILPRAGTMLFFLSNQWKPEILPATKESLFVTGYFK